MKNTITPEMLPAFEGVLPAMIASSSVEGIPNITAISQVFYLDENHVVLSRQFFNKTVENVEANPWVRVVVTCSKTYAIYKLLLRFQESQQDGPVYESMAIQLEAIAGAQHKKGTFYLQAADLYEVMDIERIYPLSREVVIEEEN